MKNASHEETDSGAAVYVINKLSCSLVGKSQTVHIITGSNAFRAYGKLSVVEKFQCNYGLNETYRNDLNDGRLKITGFDLDGNARIIELPAHRFFIATLYLPQFSSEPGATHPLILSFINSAKEYKYLNLRS